MTPPVEQLLLAVSSSTHLAQGLAAMWHLGLGPAAAGAVPRTTDSMVRPWGCKAAVNGLACKGAEGGRV